MSGPQTDGGASSLDRDAIVASIRAASGVAPGSGPDDDHLFDAVRGFVEAFDYWYIRVMREAVPKYRNLVIARINPFVRRIQCEGLGAEETAAVLIGDYDSRNYVTAGGWAIEEMAARISPDAQKSGAAGIDLQRLDSESGDYHLYVLKSGLVTRNSDIIAQLKRNSRQAEKVLIQSRGTAKVHAYYAIAAGKTTSTFEDGIHRPSSGEFWGQMTELPQESATELVLAVAAEAGKLVKRDASVHVGALETLVSDYIASRADGAIVDWEYLAKRTMQQKPAWSAEDAARHERAMRKLEETGYTIQPTAKRRKPKS